MIIKDLVLYMASIAKTSKQIKNILNKVLSKRKCPTLRVSLIKFKSI